MYTGEIQINTDNVQDLVQSAEFLQLLQLKAECMEFLNEHIEPSNCIGICRLAMLYSQQDLEKRARSVMLGQFQNVISYPEFLGMSERELSVYLSNDWLEVQSEDMVFEVLISWTHVETEDRKDSFPSLASCVRFPLCFANFLYEVIWQEPLMADASCQRR